MTEAEGTLLCEVSANPGAASNGISHLRCMACQALNTAWFCIPDGQHMHIVCNMYALSSGVTIGNCSQPQRLPDRLHKQHCAMLYLQREAYLLHQPAIAYFGNAWAGNCTAEDRQMRGGQLGKWYSSVCCTPIMHALKSMALIG